MDLQKWVTRFQLTGNRLIESWMDLILDLLMTSPEAILYVQQQRQDHERDQNERAQVAAATPGADPHVVIPWTDEMALVAFRQLNENRRQQQRQAFPLGEKFASIDFCKSSRPDSRSEKHAHKYHDTSWPNTRSVQCART